MVVTTSRTFKTKPLWEEYWYDRREAKRAIRFMEKFCIYIEGSASAKAGDSVRLQWWQKRILMKLFGWKRIEDQTRKYRVIYIEIPRKNGKTFLTALICLYLLFADREFGAQIVCAASDGDQAMLLFNVAKSIVEANKTLKKKCKVYKKALFVPGTNSVFRVISARPKGKHGSNLHGLVVDELHAQPDRELVDVLKTSTISRRQPIELYLTTAGDDLTTICGEYHDYALKIRDKPDLDPTFLPCVYGADPEKWKEESEWFKANPNLGVTFELKQMRDDFKLASLVPAYENTFKRLRLNIWTEQEHRAIPMEYWRKCVYLRPKESLRKRECFMGVDLSSNTDISSAVLVFPPIPALGINYYDTQRFYWFPELNAELRRARTKKDILPWGQQGLIKLTEGNVVDQDVIRRDINELNKIYKIREIAIDRWNSAQLQTQLQGDGFTVFQFGQGFGAMTSPTKALIGFILSKKLNHDGDPVLDWMAGNFAVQTSASGDIKPAKDKARDKIDGMVALIMALSRALVHQSSIEPSIGRGLVVLR